jgi:biotin carboxylase
MNVVLLSPAYPPEMQQYTRGLAEVGARVFGVGDSPLEALPAHTRRHLTDYLQVPRILDEDDVIRRVSAWLRGRSVDRLEGIWEVVTVLAARLRELLGIPGMSLDTVQGFRDKQLMKERVQRAGIRVPRSRRARSVDEIIEAARDFGYPIVVKPIAGAGSADTFRITDAADLKAALQRIRHVDEASVEEFIEGDEYTFETLCIEGRPVYTSVSQYFPNALVARQNEWISPIIFAHRHIDDPKLKDGVEMGMAAIKALGMGTGITHMEWYRKPSGEAVFGEIACRPPGANMVDLMNYASDIDLFLAWARAVARREFTTPVERRYNAAIIFKRAIGQGRIARQVGVGDYVRRFGPHIARLDLLPVGAPRRDWKQTFLSDGNIVVRHPDAEITLAMARAATTDVRLYAR